MTPEDLEIQTLRRLLRTKESVIQELTVSNDELLKKNLELQAQLEKVSKERDILYRVSTI